MNIYPSILEDNLDKFTAQFAKLSPFFNHFQIDIADGQFVDNRTVQIEELEEWSRRWGRAGARCRVRARRDGELKRSRAVEERLGGKTFEFHLMVNDYQTELEKLKSLSEQIKITQVLIHLAPFLKNPQSSSQHLNFSYPPHLPIAPSAFHLGLVLSPEDQVVPNIELIKTFPTVQLMTIHPGAQGNPFMPEMLTKISELRENGFTGDIILDGGINNETLPLILKNTHLPTAVCPGSYLHEDTENRLKKLRDELSSRTHSSGA